jgi:hypothetical protein
MACGESKHMLVPTFAERLPVTLSDCSSRRRNTTRKCRIGTGACSSYPSVVSARGQRVSAGIAT